MDKIRELVKQLGGSAEMADNLIEAVEGYVKSEEQKLEKTFQDRLQRAKAVCLESTEKYKAELARKVEIFLEARANVVTREAQKQAAIGESKSSKTLTSIKRLVEGVDLEVQDNQAVTENKKLRLKVAKLEEGTKALEQKASRNMGLARKLLEANKALQARPSQKIAESKRATAKELKDLRQESAKPKTKKAINEDTLAVARPKKPEIESGDPAINEIAKGLDSEPAFL